MGPQANADNEIGNGALFIVSKAIQKFNPQHIQEDHPRIRQQAIPQWVFSR